MKAILFTARGSVEVSDVALDRIPAGHALVRVRASGLCHTDIEILAGNYGSDVFPLVPGHEFAGVVEDVADDVSHLAVGAAVVVDPNIACGQCRSCRRGLKNLCENLEAYGVTRNGGFADYCLVAADHLHEIGDMDFGTAALAEPLACVLNGLDTAGFGSTADLKPETALVIGSGPIGLLLALTLKAGGVSEVSVADVNEDRLSFAQSMGLKPLAAGSAALATQRRGFDFVADATGVAAVAAGMPDYVANGGTALFFGVCAPEARIEVSPFEIFRRQIRLCGAHSLNGQIARAVALLRTEEGSMSRLVSHRLPIEELAPFFRKGGATSATMKVQFAA